MDLEKHSYAQVLAEEGTNEVAEEPSATRQRRGGGMPARVLAGIILLAVAGTVLFAVSGSTRKLGAANFANTTQLVRKLETNTEDSCGDYPYLKIESMKKKDGRYLNNLGGAGPEYHQPEGIVYEAVALTKASDTEGHKVDVHFNADSFVSYSAHAMGFGVKCNSCMAVNIRGGNQPQKFEITVTERDGTEAITLEALDLSFFDIDKHRENEDQEFFEVGGFSNYVLTKDADLEVDEKDGLTRFSSKAVGDGNDNPTKPTELTELQARRTASIIFEPFTKATVVVGTTGEIRHRTYRSFEFSGRPSLMCAKGVNPDNIEPKNPFVASVEETCCVLKLGPIHIICTEKKNAKWYHFMC